MHSGRASRSIDGSYRQPVLPIIASLNSEKSVVCFHCSTPIQYCGLHSTYAGQGKQLNGEDNTGATERIVGCYCCCIDDTSCGERSAIKSNARTQTNRSVV